MDASYATVDTGTMLLSRQVGGTYRHGKSKEGKGGEGVGARSSSVTFKLMYGSFATVGGALENLDKLFGDN